MGYETKCRARVTDASGVREADATVLLETDDLIVRGDARVKPTGHMLHRCWVRVPSAGAPFRSGGAAECTNPTAPTTTARMTIT